MESSVQMWGNSLALRIPKAFAEEVGLSRNSKVELSLAEGALVIRKLHEPQHSLEALVDQITEDNRHEEVDFGPPRGREIW